MNNLPNQAAAAHFLVHENVMQIGGMPLTRLAEKVGATPFYAYDHGLIERRIAELRAALPDSIRIHYALKANPMPALVQHLAGLVDGFDVASSGELMRALDTSMTAKNISIAGPAKTLPTLKQAIEVGVLINLESELELDRVARLAAELSVRPKVAIRVNPDFELKSSGMKMGSGPKPFGIDAEKVPAMLARMHALPIEFQGFHIYAGSQNLNAESIAEAQRNTLDLVRRLAVHAPGPVRSVNLGGGFGIPYFAGESALDLSVMGQRLAEMLPAAQRDFPEAEFVLELGRYLVGEAGVYVCRVVDRKESRGQLFLITDGGMHHNLAASGNLGQVLRKNYPVIVGNRVHADAAPPQLATVVGPLCTPLDVLADKMELGHAQVGDLIVVMQSGAYGLSASPTAFLGHPVAQEVLV